MNAAILVIMTLFGVIGYIPSENEIATQYIEKYKHLAVSEMQRAGIPASIKMAQAMLESGMGQSTLANQANNHFGIKCGGKWNGEEYYRKDDDYRNGELIKSCFRKYPQAASSFVAHSDFLMNQPRYGSLFELDKLDYKSWAHGLKKAGYATDPNYPSKLIGMIEKYDLHLLDLEIMNRPSDILATVKTDGSEKPQRTVSPKSKDKTRTRSRSSNSVRTKYSVSEINKVKVIVSTGNENLRQIAKDQKVSLKELKKYNQHIKSRSTSSNLAIGEVVYLEKLRKNYTGSEKYHIVKQAESMMDISKRYAIDLEMLYLKNRMPLGAQPLVGEKIYLKGVGKLKNIPKYLEKGKEESKSRVLF